jgi:hypothetical protein
MSHNHERRPALLSGRPARSVLTLALAVALSAAGATAQTPTSGGAAGAADAAGAGAAPSHAAPAVYRAGMAQRGMRIMVSVNERRLLLLSGRDTLLDVPAAVGMGEGFEYDGRRFFFETPTGRRTVRMKEPNPVWTPPDWHYLEKALARGLEVVRLAAGDSVALEDGSAIVVMGDQVGRLNQYGNFWAFPPGTEIVFDGMIFIPPFGTAQRRVPDALGPYKLDMGDGYLIHGTHIFNEDSIGEAVSHGCVRLSNGDVDRLYHLVPAGTPVFIY